MVCFGIQLIFTSGLYFWRERLIVAVESERHVNEVQVYIIQLQALELNSQKLFNIFRAVAYVRQLKLEKEMESIW